MKIRGLLTWLQIAACSIAVIASGPERGWAQSITDSSRTRSFADAAQGASQGTTPEPAAPEPGDAPHDMAASAGLGALQIRGFNDVDYRVFQNGANPNTFTIGQLDLFLSSRLSPEFSVIGEPVIEAGEDNSIEIDLERILIQYSPNDSFSIAAGRYHTAIGYYNVTYHHGNWFQTAIGRPFIFRFEDDGGVLPVHGVGITAQGQIPSGRVGLRYIAEISNGRHSRSPDEEPAQNVRDENGHKAVNVGLLARPSSLPGLQAGVSVYRDRLTPATQPLVNETTMAAHIVYQSPSFEQLNEVILIRHAPTRSARVTTTTSFYTQVAPRLGRYHPYFRFEYFDVPEAELDPVLAADAGRLYGPSFGLRFDAAAAVALKLQYDRFRGPIRNQTNGLTAQVAFTF